MRTIQTRTFTLKKVALALMIAAGTLSSAYAVVTGSTGTIRGVIPVLSSPATSGAHSVDFVASDPVSLKTGDTIAMNYKYTDNDGDTDDSIVMVHWYYVPNATVGGGAYTPGTPVEITTGISNVLAPNATGGVGGSTVTVPAVALGSKIKAVITEQSLTGDLRTGHVITYDDVSQVGSFGTGPEGEPGGSTDGNTNVPSTPVAPGTGVEARIVLVGGDGTNLIGTTTKLKVGSTYQFKLFTDDGVTDLTSTVNYTWKLTGTSATAHTAAPATGFNPDANFVVPANAAAQTIVVSPDGVQGFGLAIDYNARP